MNPSVSPLLWAVSISDAGDGWGGRDMRTTYFIYGLCDACTLREVRGHRWHVSFDLMISFLFLPSTPPRPLDRRSDTITCVLASTRPHRVYRNFSPSRVMNEVRVRRQTQIVMKNIDLPISARSATSLCCLHYCPTAYV